jgi:hypothetical protein
LTGKKGASEKNRGLCGATINDERESSRHDKRPERALQDPIRRSKTTKAGAAAQGEERKKGDEMQSGSVKSTGWMGRWSDDGMEEQ